MSERFPGGIISKTAPVPTGPYETGTAPGVWTLDQQAAFVKQGIWPLAGNVPNYIEDVFSTWLYTGNGSTQTINNGIDLAGKGGLVWAKSRSATAQHVLADTVRGTGQILQTSTTNGNTATALNITSFNADGYGLSSYSGSNSSGSTYASWTFREQPKFFDVVTYTGTGANTTIAHNLGSVPGCIIIKGTNSTLGWKVYHRSTGNTTVLNLNLTDAAYSGLPSYWNSTTPTSTVFSLGDDASVNASGNTYVAYLFAHDAGGFGLTGTDNVISCGSVTTDGSGVGSVNLGYEPQWIMVKASSSTGDWRIIDNMRGFTATYLANGTQALRANNATAESEASYFCNSTGFTFDGGVSQTLIYIAIRRGPMKVPTDGTSVFAPVAVTNALGTENTTGFPLDMQIANIRSGFAANGVVPSRLTGVSSNTTSSGSYLRTPSTSAETTGSDITQYWSNTGFQTASNWAGSGMSYWNFRRAPGFFDEVCSPSFEDGVPINHNLGVTPELIIVKTRTSASNWMGAINDSGNIRNLSVNTTSAGYLPGLAYSSYFNATTINPAGIFNGGGGSSKGSILPVVIYLFASCPGVSKVFSFTGNGTTQTINCGFTGGARFVLLKATSTTGGWFVYDTARGMTVLTDPYLQLNSTAAESATLGSVTTAATGFAVNELVLAGVNTNGVSYIGLAIA